MIVNGVYIKVLGIIVVAICLKTAEKLERLFKLHRWYISIPFIGSILLIVLSKWGSGWFSLSFPPIFQRLVLTIFLFSIGYQIAFIFNRKYFYRVLFLIGICLFLISSLHLVSFLFPDSMHWVLSSILFAYNLDVVYYTVPKQWISYIHYWGSIQMLVVFLLTPILLIIVEKRLRRLNHPSSLYLVHQYHEKMRIPINFTSFFVVFIAFLFVKLPAIFNIPFVYDYVYSLMFGLLIGYFFGHKKGKTKKATIEQLGTVALYTFIMTTIIQNYQVHHNYFSINIFLLILIKTFVIAFICFFVVYSFFQKLSYHERMVAFVAGWTFILNAPVVCMHGMRSVTNKLGAAPYVLLVIPPVILWLVNYLHVWLLQALPRSFFDFLQ